MSETQPFSVWLEKGESVPAYCPECKLLYRVPLDSEASECPKCGRTVIHGQQPWKVVWGSDEKPA